MIKVELEKICNNKDNAFIVDRAKGHYFERPLHYHPEFEVVYVKEGQGLCFAGDGIVDMKPKRLYFFSSNMYHTFKSAPSYYKKECKDYCESFYIQFKENILPLDYKEMPGCKYIKHLINEGNFGLMWSEEETGRCFDFFEKIENTKYCERLCNLYTFLNFLGENVEKAKKISSECTSVLNYSTDVICKKLFAYITYNFQKRMTLDGIAAYIGMNKSALCRYIKNKTGESIFDSILRIRIAYAKNQLANSGLNISSIAYDSGFNNLSNFNVYFKRVVGYTPSQYRQNLDLKKSL